MKGININDDYCPYSDWIVRGVKKMETRNVIKGTEDRGPLDHLIGERVAIISTHKDRKARVVGYATIDSRTIIKCRTIFEDLFSEHIVDSNSPYRWLGFGLHKVGYSFSNVERVKPFELPDTVRGNVVRNIPNKYIPNNRQICI